MNRPLNFSLFLLACVITVTTYAQSEPVPVMNLGDPTPPLHLRTWIKGKPVNTFEKGEIYVLEFWATWCKPCVAAMPHLSALAREYRDRVTVLGIDVMESKTTSIQKIKAFVKKPLKGGNPAKLTAIHENKRLSLQFHNNNCVTM